MVKALIFDVDCCCVLPAGGKWWLVFQKPLVFGMPLFSRASWKAPSSVFKVPAASFLNSHGCSENVRAIRAGKACLILMQILQFANLLKQVYFWLQYLLKRYSKRLPWFLIQIYLWSYVYFFLLFGISNSKLCFCLKLSWMCFFLLSVLGLLPWAEMLPQWLVLRL